MDIKSKNFYSSTVQVIQSGLFGVVLMLEAMKHNVERAKRIEILAQTLKTSGLAHTDVQARLLAEEMVDVEKKVQEKYEKDGYKKGSAAIVPDFAAKLAAKIPKEYADMDHLETKKVALAKEIEDLESKKRYMQDNIRELREKVMKSDRIVINNSYQTPTSISRSESKNIPLMEEKEPQTPAVPVIVSELPEPSLKDLYGAYGEDLEVYETKPKHDEPAGLEVYDVHEDILTHESSDIALDEEEELKPIVIVDTYDVEEPVLDHSTSVESETADSVADTSLLPTTIEIVPIRQKTLVLQPVEEEPSVESSEELMVEPTAEPDQLSEAELDSLIGKQEEKPLHTVIEEIEKHLADEREAIRAMNQQEMEATESTTDEEPDALIEPAVIILGEGEENTQVEVTNHDPDLVERSEPAGVVEIVDIPEASVQSVEKATGDETAQDEESEDVEDVEDHAEPGESEGFEDSDEDDEKEEDKKPLQPVDVSEERKVNLHNIFNFGNRQ
jgi:hypothetical protein